MVRRNRANLEARSNPFDSGSTTSLLLNFFFFVLVLFFIYINKVSFPYRPLFLSSYLRPLASASRGSASHLFLVIIISSNSLY